MLDNDNSHDNIEFIFAISNTSLSMMYCVLFRVLFIHVACL